MKFKGKFQECCQINWSRPSSSYLWPQLYGWESSQHCHCEVCTKRRIKLNLKKCTKEDRCPACVKMEK